jgi:hypothetical protein
LGTTGLSDDVSLGGLSSATFSDPNAGLSAIVQGNDVIVSGTPLADHAGELTLTLTLKTPDGLLTIVKTATLLINATTPNVIAGTLNPVSVGGTYDQTFANSGTTGPMVTAGASEYFDEANTTFAVVDKNNPSNILTDSFELVYHNSGTVANGATPVNNGNNQIELKTKEGVTLSQATTFTVTFHVVNVDMGNGPGQSQPADGSPGDIKVGAVPAYLYCPIGSSAEVVARQDSYSSSYSTPAMTGTPLETLKFDESTKQGSGTLQLSMATISNGHLMCEYNVYGANGSPLYRAATEVALTNLKANGTGWSGSSCTVKNNVDPTTAAKSCQVSYDFQG